jgi:hypothetical protein
MSQRAYRQVRRGALACAGAAVLMLSGTVVPAWADSSEMTLSSVSGPSGVQVTATITDPSKAIFAAGRPPVVQFQYAGMGTACAATMADIAQIDVSGTTTTAGVLTAEPDTVKRFSNTKIAFRVPFRAYPAYDGNGFVSTVNPNGLTLGEAQPWSRWHVCAYSDDTATGTLLTEATYTLVPRPVITAIQPASSPAMGGMAVTVTGAGFTEAAARISGSIGGRALTDITVAADGKSFTAKTGPRVAEEGLALVVDTAGGRISSLDPDGNGLAEDNDPGTADTPIPFRYSNGISVTPNHAAVGTQVNLDVLGAGFADLDFSNGGGPSDGNAHVFLVDDSYDSSSNRGVAECGDVAVVSDNELICTLDLSAGQLNPQDSSVLVNVPIVEGTYTLTVVATGVLGADAATAKPTIVSSGSTFTVGPY